MENNIHCFKFRLSGRNLAAQFNIVIKNITGLGATVMDVDVFENEYSLSFMANCFCMRDILLYISTLDYCRVIM